MSAPGGRSLRAAGSTAKPGTGQSGNGAIRPRAASNVKGRRSSAFPRLKHEHYVEEPWVSARLFAHYSALLSNPLGLGALGAAIVDPAAGFGHIVRSARRAGFDAVGCDLVKRAACVRGGRDFLSPRWRRPLPDRPISVVCNPPFGPLRAFVEKALAIADVGAAMLVPTRRLNAAHWLADTPLAEILYVTPRPSLWPGAIYRRRVAQGLPLGTGREDVAWLIFRIGGAYEGRAGWLHRDGGAG